MTISQKIFSFPEVRVVEASAGSGKTFALAKRYVQLLLYMQKHKKYSLPMRHILAITFTNKAAFEMKARILDFLKKTALQTLSTVETREILLPLGLEGQEASDLAFVIMEELIHHYNFFQVQTIDSFINALLSGCAFKIGLSANFKIKRQVFPYLEYSLDRLIDAAGRDPQLMDVFIGFLDQYLFLENRPGWFPQEDILSLVRALNHQSNIFGKDFKPYPIKTDALPSLKREILGQMRELQNRMPEGTNARFVNSLTEFLARYKQNFDFDNISDFFTHAAFPARAGIEIPEKVDRLWQDIRLDLHRLSEAEAYSVFNPYIAVYHFLSRDFAQKAAQDDVLFLEELNRKACHLFDEGMVTVEELYYRLATRFRHYLIDEFQDTSALQWRNLYLMIEEALSTGGSFFYVGDKKQAIYGFRGGDVSLFDRIQEKLVAFNVQHEQLTVNYRSCPAIVSFNNQIFSRENLMNFIHAKETHEQEKKKKDSVFFSEEETGQIIRVFSASQQAPAEGSKGGHVRVRYLGDEKKESRDEDVRRQVMDLLRDLRKRYDYSEVAILTRGNKEIEQITGWLMEEGIPVESERTVNIAENRLIQQLLSFLQFLNSPIDNRALSFFFLGDMFLAAARFSQRQMHDFLFEHRERLRESRPFTLYRAFRERYPDVWDKLIDEYFRHVGFYPLYELAVSIIHRFEILKHFPAQQAFVMRFLELIKEQEEETTDIDAFLKKFPELEAEDLFIHVPAVNAIKLQTIHKSKGLQFPVVIIPFLGINVQVSSHEQMGQQSFLLDEAEDHLELLRIKSKYLPYSERLSGIRRAQYMKSLLAELNSVYVALTRAARELYLFVPKRVGNSFNLAQFLIPEGFESAGEVEDLARKKQETSAGCFPRQQKLRLSLSIYQDWIQYLENEFAPRRDLLQREKMLRGEILHFVLAHIGQSSGGSAQSLAEAAFKQARLRFPQRADWADIERQVTQILAHSDLNKFFTASGGEVYQEVEVVNALGHTKRIDRLIVKPQEVWVLDYKSTREDRKEHEDQVKEYMEIMRDIYPGRPVKGFLIFLDQMTSQEI